MTVVSVGTIFTVAPRGRVPRPPPRIYERAVILDVGPIIGAVGKQARAFFRLRRPLARDREVGFQLGEIKAANFRPGFYRYRLEIQADPLTSPEDATIVRAGELVPGSVPPTITFNDIRVIEGVFTLASKDVVIQAFDEEEAAEIKPPPREEAEAVFDER